jgi:DNA-binding NtrC family response regulator
MNAARKLLPQSAVILLTAFASVPDAVSAMKSGACEYLVKPVSLEQLLETADRVCAAANSLPCQMIGSSPALRHALDTAQQAAASDADILIQAESGTGKELLARMVHSLSARRECPFIAINCAGIPESLLESELFGHGRGAFTGAEKTQLGKFQLADTGTLLLDEIGEMPLSLQPKLLRALQEREFYPLGEPRPVKVNIRVIATTNRCWHPW